MLHPDRSWEDEPDDEGVPYRQLRCAPAVTAATDESAPIGSTGPRSRPAVNLACAGAVLVCVGFIVAAVVLHGYVVAHGRGDAAAGTPDAVIVYGLAMASAAASGVIVAYRRPDHPVGWLFLGLAGLLAGTPPLDEWAGTVLLAKADRLSGSPLAAVLSGTEFVTWFVLIAMILHLTPTGRTLSKRWGWLARVTVIAGVATVGLKMIQTKPLKPPYRGIRNPWGLPGLSAVVDPLEFVSVMAVGLGLIVAAVSLMVRFRRSRGVERRQLMWVGAVALIIPFVAVAAFVSAWTNHPVVLTVTTGAFVAGVPVAAGLSVLRFHLYDVDRIVSRATAYVVLTMVAVGTYAATAVTVGLFLGRLAGRSQATAAFATLAALAVTGPAHRWVRDGVDRRFNRRRFDALALVHAHVRDRDQTVSVDDVLRRALNDPSVQVAYWVAERGIWVTAGGLPACPTPADVTLRRGDSPVAAIGFDRDRVEPQLVEAVAGAAAPALETVGLRAALALELAEVQASRARIVAAELAERRRIERNLHDGAQQRLLGLAFEVRAVEVSGDPERAVRALRGTIEGLQDAIADLRELASGLHPSILVDGGLAAAFDDLAARTRLPVDLRVTGDRFAPDVEAAAWFIGCEAVTNAVKHAQPSRLAVAADRIDGRLVVTVSDDGTGGAVATGSGLQGIADRAGALGGRLALADRPGGGTVVTAELPCGS